MIFSTVMAQVIFIIFVKVIICLILTIISSHFLVKFTAKIAEAFSIPSYIISLTILSIGTSIAEVVTSIQSVLVTQSLQMTLGNIIGSNIFNTAISYALLLLFTKNQIQISKNDQIYSIISFVCFVAISHFASYNSIVAISLIMILFMYYWRSLRNNSELEQENGHNHNVLICFGVFTLSLIGIIYSSKFFIEYAVDLAHIAQISDYIIGVTIIAVGTSFPELITTVTALAQKKPEIALGNIIGSNIFNILGILGIGVPIYEWFTTNNAIISLNFIDLAMLAICTFSIILTIYIKQILYKWIGLFLIGVYILYVLTIAGVI